MICLNAFNNKNQKFMVIISKLIILNKQKIYNLFINYIFIFNINSWLNLDCFYLKKN